MGTGDSLMSDEEANKAVVRRFVAEVWNAGALTATDDLVQPAYVVEGVERGPDFIRHNVTALRRAFPDLDVAIEQMVAEGDWVAVRLTLRGTHLGPLGGIPPTFRWAEMREMAFWKVEDGRVRAVWSVGDALGLRVQLGALPASAWHRPVLEAEDAN